jgi:hypothetical protein
VRERASVRLLETVSPEPKILQGRLSGMFTTVRMHTSGWASELSTLEFCSAPVLLLISPKHVIQKLRFSL